MSINLAILICVLSIIIFIPHSYLKYGGKLTFNFFFFAFFLAAIKEAPMRTNGILTKNPAMPYEFLTGHPSIVVNTFLTMIGWVFTFYLGWYIADKISERLYPQEKYIFPTLLLVGLATASIGYAVEATAIGIGWWHWTLQDMRLSGYLAGIPFITIVTWMHFPTQYLFTPYFLINCSKFKKANWKGIFFLIPFIHSFTADFKPESVRVGVEYMTLVILIVLAFASPLRLNYPRGRLLVLPHFFKRRWIELLPMLIGLLLVAILVFFDLARAQNSKLLISLFPLGFLILLTVKKIPVLWIMFLAVICFLLFKAYALPAVILVMIIVLLKTLTKIRPFKYEHKECT